MKIKFLLLLSLGLCGLNLWGAPVDASGVRIFPERPAPGIHPRVYITAGEKADLKRRMYETEFGQQVVVKTLLPRAHDFMFKGPGQTTYELTAAEIEALDADALKARLAEHWEGFAQYLGVLSLEAWVNDDAELKQHAIRFAVNRAKLVLQSKELLPDSAFWREPDYVGRDWNLGDEFKMGGVGLSAAYDLLFNDMTEAQRATVRECISVSISGRRSHALGWPKTKLFSNWFPLHGEMGVMMLTIEGEPGYDPEIMELWQQGLKDWLEVGISHNGANHEDAYIYYALRGGLPIFLATARRGDQLAGHPSFRNLLKWQAMWEPAYGPLKGYQTFHVITHRLYPNDPIANMFWARRAGENYQHPMQWQSAFYTLLCGDDYDGSYADAVDYDQLGLPASMFDKRRGVQIVRNGNGPEDLLFRLHARADSMFVGHASVDSGTFELQANGRQWTYHAAGDKEGAFHSSDNSLVHIDGKAQGMKPPIVNVLNAQDAGEATVITADLSYAYNWQWLYDWPNPNVAGRELPGAPWVPEQADPYELGWPKGETWLPRDLSNQPDLGFEGIWQMKKRINEVEYAHRSAVVARGAHPYVLIVDDVKQDDAQREYRWKMATPKDLSFAGSLYNDLILQEQSNGDQWMVPLGSKRLLVRELGHYADLPGTRNPYFYDSPEFIHGVEFGDHQSIARHSVNAERTRFDVGTSLFRSLSIPHRGTEAKFVVLLFPYNTDIENKKDLYYDSPLGASLLPQTVWNADRTELTVTVGEQVDVFQFKALKTGRREVHMSRNGKKLF